MAERDFHFLEFRRALQLQGGIAALDRERQVLAGANADNALHVGEASDLAVIDRRDDIADLKARRSRSTARLDLIDARRRARLAEEREQAGEDHDRQNEVGNRARGHDRRARSDLLVVETALALFLGHVGERVRRRRRGLGLVAEELDIAAERNRRNLPARAMAVVETDQFRTETKRERQHFHARPAGDQEVTEFMEENHDRQHEQKGNDVPDEPMAQRIETMQEKLGHPIPLNQSRKPCPQRSKMPLRQFEAIGWQLYFARYGQRRWHRPRTSMAPNCRSESRLPMLLRRGAQSRRI